MYVATGASVLRWVAGLPLGDEARGKHGRERRERANKETH